MKIFPLNDQIAIELTDMPDVTDGGIYLPPDTKGVPQTGTVIAISVERIGKYPHIGDTILFAKYAGNPFKIDGKNILMLNAESILAVLQDEA